MSRRKQQVTGAIAQFWEWFLKHEESMAPRETGEPLLEEMRRALARVHRDLVAEVGPPGAMPRELVISAGGDTTLFPIVNTLVDAAPRLFRWRIIKFRPARPDVDRIACSGLTVSIAAVRFLLQREGKNPEITLFMPGYADADHARYVAAAFMLLDALLGEYDVETRVGRIVVRALDDATDPAARPLTDLPRDLTAWASAN